MSDEPTNDGEKSRLAPVERPVGRCWWLHDWGAWIDIREGTRTMDGRVIGFYIRQERHCKRCNRVQIKLENAF